MTKDILSLVGFVIAVWTFAVVYAGGLVKI